MQFPSRKNYPDCQLVGQAIIDFDRRGNPERISIIASSEQGERLVKAALHRRKLFQIPPPSRPFEVLPGGRT